MKHSELCAIAHNIADSLASGQGFLIGYFPTEIFAEVAQSAEGHISVDFLTGQITGGHLQIAFAKQLFSMSRQLPRFSRSMALQFPTSARCLLVIT